MTASSASGTRSATFSLTLLLCLLTASLEGFDIQSMGVAAPRMAPALGLTKLAWGNAASASLFGLMVGAALGGWLADRVGRKPVIVGSVVVFGLFTLATATAHDYGLLLAVRFITGLGLGGALPMIIAVASEEGGGGSEGASRSAVVSAITACMPLGGSIVALYAASPLGADWRAIFIAGGAAPLLLAAALWRFLPETRAARPAGERAAGSWLSALFGPGRTGITLSLWVGYAAIALVLHFFLNWLPQILKSRGFAGGEALTAQIAFNIGGVVGGIILGWIIQRAGARWPMALTAAALIGALLGLAGGHTAFALTAALAFAVGFLIMGIQFGLYGLGPGYYASEVRGRGVGAAVAAGRFGSAMGPLLAGMLLGAGATGGQVVSYTIPVVVAAGLAAVLLSFAKSSPAP